MSEASRVARLTHGGRLLWIIQRKKGKPDQIDLYVVEDARPDPLVADPAFRLTKSAGTQYTVALHAGSATCCCQDANYRHRACKHCRALKAVGLLKKPEVEE